MDYKKLIRSRSTRQRMLSMLSFVPDKPMLRIQYLIKTGHLLKLKNPKRFTEKLQWYKLNYKNPLMIQCVDKYDVREYVVSKGLNSILLPCYGVYNSPDEIDWDSLPEKFVMKDTLGGGGNSVIIVREFDQESIEELRKKSFAWVNKDIRKKNSGREWPYYSGKKHRIVIEKLLESDGSQTGLVDYKFFCFNGKCEFLYVMGDREVGKSVKVSIFDRDFNKLPVLREGDEEYTDAAKPDQYEEMVKIAEKISTDFPHVRVDLYNTKGHVYFGELTFFNASGYMKYEPDSFDIEIGEKWCIGE